MKVDGIYSIREHKGRSYTDIVYEWEQDLASALDVPVLHWSWRHELAARICRLFPRLAAVKDAIFGEHKHYLRFVMNAMEDTPLFNHRSCVPVIIDYFVADVDIDKFIGVYDQCEYVCVSSRQVYDKLVFLTLPFKVIHLPLTISDCYLYESGAVYDKKYPLILLGTQIYDSAIKPYVDRYSESHPDFVYVYKEDGGERYYTNTGELVADATSRDNYFKLLRASKVAVYTTPAQRGRPNCNGYDPVTPKFLEMIASQCVILARWSDNADAAFFEIDKYAHLVTSYEDFERLMEGLNQTHIDLDSRISYLKRHATSALLTTLNNV